MNRSWLALYIILIPLMRERGSSNSRRIKIIIRIYPLRVNILPASKVPLLGSADLSIKIVLSWV
jgi:hypothetical protein